MAKLLLIPLIDGYSYTPPNETLSVQLDGGSPRKRRDKLGIYGEVTCKFILNSNQYRYFMAFYRQRIKGGSLPFTIDLKTEYHNLREHEAILKPDSLSLTQQNADLFFISVSLNVKPFLRDATADQALISSFGA